MHLIRSIVTWVLVCLMTSGFFISPSSHASPGKDPLSPLGGYCEGGLTTRIESQEQIILQNDSTHLPSNLYRVFTDNLGRPQSIQIGGTDLIRYAYDGKFAQAKQIQYINGDTVTFKQLDSVNSLNIYQNKDSVPTWSIDYTPWGAPKVMVDRSTGRRTEYTYDAHGRLLNTEEFCGDILLSEIQVSYDTESRIATYSYTLPSGSAGKLTAPRSFSYSYNNNGQLSSTMLPADVAFQYSYWEGKQSTRKIVAGRGPLLAIDYAYSKADSEAPTCLTTTFPGGNVQVQYQFGNGGTTVVGISDEAEKLFSFDQEGRLVSASCGSNVTNYTFDPHGNISKRTILSHEDSFSYENDQRPDLLTAYNGQPIQYDPFGNPLHWFDGTVFSWDRGYLLGAANNAQTGLDVSFRYDYNGNRIEKTLNGLRHSFLWYDNQLLYDQFGQIALEFYYDERGIPYAFFYRSGEEAGELYYYVTDLFGSVTDIVDGNGEPVGHYTYDPWGKLTSISGDIAGLNPLRYRGWYYDSELGMYYTSRRYYSPELCRYINPGDYSCILDGSANNAYTFCNNNPMAIPLPPVTGPWSFHGFVSDEAVERLQESEQNSDEDAELTYDQKVFIATICAEVTSSAQGYPVSPIARQAVACVIMNRIGQREWEKYKSAAEICAYTGFTAYGNAHFKECMDYLNRRDGSNALVEEIISQVLPIYLGEIPDITGGAQIFYTPAAMSPHRTELGWNPSLLQEVIISGVDPYYEARFFRYKN